MSDDELIERLKRRVADFALVPNFKQERPMRLVNPDGPEAASRITELREALEQLRRASPAGGSCVANHRGSTGGT